MATIFYALSSEDGLKKLDDYLLSHSCITGYQTSKDDLTVRAAVLKSPPSSFVNVTQWYNHIEALLRLSGVSAEGSDIVIEGSARVTTPLIVDTKPPLAEEDDDDDVDLFGEETEKEKKVVEERAAVVKASRIRKNMGHLYQLSAGNSSVLK